jgi:hypothetical protein
MTIRLAGLLCVGLIGCGMPAMAQQPPAGPMGPQLQDATIFGRGDTITVRRLPVRTPAGVVYRDITIKLQVDSSGAVRADARGHGSATPATMPRAATAVIAHDVTVGQVTETATAPEVAAPFTAGLYRDDANGGLVRLVNQGKHLFEAFPTWALASVSGDTVISAAEWYAGPIRTNPHHALLQRAGVTSDSYSYGVVDANGSGHFDMGMLIGAVQNGRTLTVVSFHRRGCCTYASSPTSEVTYTLVGR